MKEQHRIYDFRMYLLTHDNVNDVVDELFESFEIHNFFRNINEREQFYFRLSSNFALPNVTE